MAANPLFDHLVPIHWKSNLRGSIADLNLRIWQCRTKVLENDGDASLAIPESIVQPQIADVSSFCIECEDQPASITCLGCEGEIYCSVCHGSLYRKASRRRHETKAFGTASLDIAMTEAPLVQDEKRVKRAIPYLWLFLLHKARLVIISSHAQSIFR